MNYLTIAIHYPKPEHRQHILDAMQKLHGAAQGMPGLVTLGAWLDSSTDRIIAMSLWETAEQGQAAWGSLIPLIANVPLDTWERQPREVMMQLVRAV